MNRRHFLKSTLAAAALPVAAASGQAAPPQKKRILLRSSWQTVNIGDIAHTPGMLALLEKYLPEHEITLWPGSVENGVKELLNARFPKLKILGKDKASVDEAIRSHDFLLHGSGPGLVAQKDVLRWKETGKPYGIGGVTFGGGKEGIEIISGARFAFFRDSVSLAVARDNGATCPLMEFGPDATFACDLADDATAIAYLKASGLEAGKFVCCIPKLRFSPYWEIKPGVKFDAERDAYNRKMKEHDIAPLRNAVIAVARETPLKILLCPEDSSQMKLNKEMIYDQLPADVKSRVVWRESYWLTAEATSVYSRSAGLFGNEQHSPILCISHGIPAIVCRYKEQTSKGFMWRDIGLGEWLFDHDHDEAETGLTPSVLAIVNDPAAAKAKALKAKAFADERMKHMMDVLRRELA